MVSQETLPRLLYEKVPFRGSHIFNRWRLPIGAPVFIYFRLVGTALTNSSQLLSVNAAADLVIAQNLCNV